MTILPDERFQYHLNNFVILETPQYYNNSEDRFYKIDSNNIIHEFLTQLGGIKLTKFQKEELVDTVKKYVDAYQRFLHIGWKYDKFQDEKSWLNLDIDSKSDIWFLKARNKNFIDKLLTFDIPSAPEAPNPIPQYLEKEQTREKELKQNNNRLKAIIKLLVHNKGYFTFDDVTKELLKINININKIDKNEIKILKTLIKRYTKEEKGNVDKYWKNEFEEYRPRRKERLEKKKNK